MYLVIGCGNAGSSLAREFMMGCSAMQRPLFKAVFIDSIQNSNLEASVLISSDLYDLLRFGTANQKIRSGIDEANAAPVMAEGFRRPPEGALGKKFEDGFTFFKNNREILAREILKNAELERTDEVEFALIFYSLAGVTGGGGSPVIGEIFKDKNIPAIGVGILPAAAEGFLLCSNALKSLSKSLEYMSAVVLADNEVISTADFSKPSESLSIAYKKLNSFIAKGMRDLTVSYSGSERLDSPSRARSMDFRQLIRSVNLKGKEGIEKGVGVIGRAAIPFKFWGGLEEARPSKWIELLQKQLSVNINAELEIKKIQMVSGVIILHKSIIRNFPFEDFGGALAILANPYQISVEFYGSSKMAVSMTFFFSLYPRDISRICRMNKTIKSSSDSNKGTGMLESPFEGIFGFPDECTLKK